LNEIILAINDQGLRDGYVKVTKVDEKGRRQGLTPLSQVADLLREIFENDAARRPVRLVSKFEQSPYLAWGQNGARWTAVQELPPAGYFLTVAGKAYKVALPRLIAKVSNYGDSFLWWTDAEQLTPETKAFPLMIGNIDYRGWICIGTTGLKCETPEEIGKFVKRVIEAPTTGAYLEGKGSVDTWYQNLTVEWDKSVGAKHGVALKRILGNTEDRGW